jgi:uncharacterized protein (DUF58 family)
MVSAMLGFMSVTGIAGWMNLRKLDILLTLPEEIYCTLPAVITVRLSSRRRIFPYFLLTLHVEGATTKLSYLKPGSPICLKLPTTFEQRGQGKIDRVFVSSPFPVNFFIRSNIIDTSVEYLVFPRPEPFPPDLATGGSEKSGGGAAHIRGGGEYAGTIAPYTGLEPLKQVHWRLSARHGELKVKETKAETGTPVIINPDELPGTLEQRLSYSTYLINTLMAKGNPVGLDLDGDITPAQISGPHRLRLLGKLSRYAQNKNRS